jgi:hypothetical protein
MTNMTAAEVDSILTQLEAAGVIKRGKTTRPPQPSTMP